MKNLIFIFLFFGVATLYIGCSDNNPSAPQLNQNDQLTSNLEKSTIYSYFTGTSETQFPFVYDGRTNILPDGTIQIRGCIVETEDILSDARISGIITWIVHLDIYPDGSDKRWGSGETEDRQWDMTFKGWYDLVDGVTYEVEAHGKGEYKGMTAHLTYRKPIGEPLFAVNGYIIERL